MTNQAVDLYVPAVGLEQARIAALRVAFFYLDWHHCTACPAADVHHAGLPLDKAMLRV